MRVDVAPDYEGMSRRAGEDLLRRVRSRPDLLLGLATGASPARAYARLAEARAAEPALFQRVRVLKLDEWLGLPARHPATSEAYLREHVLGPLAVGRSRYQGWRMEAEDRQAECHRMARWLARHGPIDVCVLGLGTNGHLLMNEPAAALRPGPHVARLAEETRRHSMLRSVKRAPRFGLTLGLADMLRSRAILLLVSGWHKAAPLRRMLAGRVSTDCPASFLWLHPDVTVYCDREASHGRG